MGEDEVGQLTRRDVKAMKYYPRIYSGVMSWDDVDRLVDQEEAMNQLQDPLSALHLCARVPVIYDNANEHGNLTVRLIAMMKKAMGAIGDEPEVLAIDGAQYFDEEDEDYRSDLIRDELNLEVELIPRFENRRNWFCVMTGKGGRTVIGVYGPVV